MKHNGNGQRRPEDIQADIERTRNNLDQTLSAIERRLSPGELVDQCLDYLRNSGARQYVGNLGRAAKDDPLPLALLGVALGWLMLSNGRKRDHDGVAMHDPGDTARHALGDTVSSVKQKVAATTERLSNTAERFSQTAHAARERVGELSESAQRQAARVRSGYDHLVHEQPLALGAIGLALGAVLAAAAPRTRQEDRLLGDASDRLEADAKDAGRAHLDHAKHAATAAQDTARDSLERDYGDEQRRDEDVTMQENPALRPYAPYGPPGAT